MRTDLPACFTPIEPFKIETLSGQAIFLPRCIAEFARWPSPSPNAFSFGNKTFLNFEGEPVFAELMILRLFQQAHWEGVWVSCFGKKFLQDMPTSWKLENAIEKHHPKTKVILEIAEKMEGRWGGCFDVFAWRGERRIFCEAKRKDKDRLRDSQKQWISAAMACDIELTDLLVVEWDIAATRATTS